jgi:hypothetical protein
MKPFILWQDIEQVKLAVEVNQNTMVGRIRVSEAKMNATMVERQGKDEVSYQTKSRVKHASEKHLTVAVHFLMSLKQEGMDEDITRVECEMEAEYFVRPGFQLSPEKAEAFAQGNAIFHLWPYFREFLQSSMTRMGQEPLLAPYLMVMPKAAQPEAPKLAAEPSANSSRKRRVVAKKAPKSRKA